MDKPIRTPRSDLEKITKQLGILGVLLNGHGRESGFGYTPAWAAWFDVTGLKGIIEKSDYLDNGPESVPLALRNAISECYDNIHKGFRYFNWANIKRALSAGRKLLKGLGKKEERSYWRDKFSRWEKDWSLLSPDHEHDSDALKNLSMDIWDAVKGLERSVEESCFESALNRVKILIANSLVPLQVWKPDKGILVYSWESSDLLSPVWSLDAYVEAVVGRKDENTIRTTTQTLETLADEIEDYGDWRIDCLRDAELAKVTMEALRCVLSQLAGSVVRRKLIIHPDGIESRVKITKPLDIYEVDEIVVEYAKYLARLEDGLKNGFAEAIEQIFNLDEAVADFLQLSERQLASA